MTTHSPALGLVTRRPGPTAMSTTPPSAPAAPAGFAAVPVALGAHVADALYRSLFALASDAIVVADDGQCILVFNHGAEEMFGYRADEVLGQPLDILLPERESARHRTEHVPGFAKAPVAARRMAERAEVRGRRKNGEEFPAEVAIARLTVDGATCFSAVVRDVTERHQMVQSLRASERRFHGIFDSAFQFVKLVAPDGTVLEANRRSLEFAGLTAEQVVGRPLWEIPWWRPSPDTTWRLRDAVARAAAGEFVRFEAEHVGARGAVLTVDFSLNPVRDERGAVTLLVAEGRDVTEQRQVRADLDRQRVELARSNAELEQFAYVASHDLQEPLRAVASYTQLLADRYAAQLDDRARKYIGFAVQGAERMQALIADLLALSRVGTQGRPFAPVSLDAMLDETLRTLRPAIAEAAATVTREPLPTVMGDAAQLRQLLQNLVGNAIKFRRPGVAPHVHVSAAAGPREWTISVRDDGIGIDPTCAERVFVIFDRLHTRDEYPGTGIGLAICRKVVERHGGRIWVEPAEGGGSVFRFTLPNALPSERSDTF